jgi:hypothetical protein
MKTTGKFTILRNWNYGRPAPDRFGVELELEGRFRRNLNIDTHSQLLYVLNKKLNGLAEKYIYDIERDITVADDETEIIFNHFPLTTWMAAQPDLADIMNACRGFGLKAGPSAGMHIHYSGRHVPGLYEIYGDKEKRTLLEAVFMTIGARKNVRQFYGPNYGVNEECFMKKIKSDTDTFEVRAFESTTNPEIFCARICVTNAVLEYAAKNPDFTIRSILWDMPHEIKSKFWYLVNTGNPNIYGIAKASVQDMLFHPPAAAEYKNKISRHFWQNILCHAAGKPAYGA